MSVLKLVHDHPNLHRLHTCDKALEERLLGKIGIVVLEMLLGWGDELQSNQLVSACVQLWSCCSWHNAYPRFSNRAIMSPTRPRCENPVNTEVVKHHQGQAVPGRHQA